MGRMSADGASGTLTKAVTSLMQRLRASLQQKEALVSASRLGTGDGELFLYITDLGWWMKAVDPAGEELFGDSGIHLLPPELDVGQKMALLNGLLDRIPADLRPQLGSIRLLLGDKATTYLAGDRKHFSKSSKGLLFSTGKEKLDSDDVGFGLINLFPSGEGDDETGLSVYGFIDNLQMRNELAAFDSDAMHVTAVTPVAAVLLAAQSADQAPGCQCAIHIGGRVSMVVLLDGENRAAYVRSIPLGVRDVIGAVALAGGIAEAAVIEELSQRNQIRDIHQETVEIPHPSGAGPTFHALIGGILESFDFFQNQRLCALPETVTLFGAHGMVQGLVEEMAAGLGVPCVIAPRSVFEVFCSLSPENALNLLQEAERPLLVIGKTSYAYSANGFVEAAEPTEVPAGGSSAETVTGKRELPPWLVNFVQTQLPTLWPLLSKMGRLSPTSKSVVVIDAKAVRTHFQIQGNRAVFAMAGLVVVGLAAIINQTFSGLEVRTRAVATYSSDLATYDSESKKVAIDPAVASKRDYLAATKVLWTEKFLSLANAMTDEVWMTDVYVEEAKGKKGSAGGTAYKLIMKGGVLPSTVGHILTIAKYMQKLKADGKYFMDDFQELNFIGASLDASENADIVRFVLEAEYEEGKRKMPAVNISGDSGGKIKSGVSSAIDAARKHNSEIDEAGSLGGVK